MNRIKRYYTALRRYNRSKGFGIHSPFAFYFVRRVLRERCPYYAYDNIVAYRRQARKLASKRKAGKQIISCENAKMLFRITCYFSPGDILQIGSTYGVSTMTMLGVSHQSRLTIYTGDNPYDNIFNEITSLKRHRIFKASTLFEAIVRYDENKAEGERFILINNIDEQEIGVVHDYAVKSIETGGVVIMRNLSKASAMKRLWNSVNADILHGMGFTNYRIGIVVGLRHLPRQNFALWF